MKTNRLIHAGLLTTLFILYSLVECFASRYSTDRTLGKDGIPEESQNFEWPLNLFRDSNYIYEFLNWKDKTRNLTY